MNLQKECYTNQKGIKDDFAKLRKLLLEIRKKVEEIE